MNPNDESLIYKYVCENDLSFFLRQAFKIVYPEQTYSHNWHVDVLCKHLEAVARGDIRNLDINIAPRTIKSLLINIVFPAWVWTKTPQKKIITASYAASLSIGFNIRRRSLIKSSWFQTFWPTKIKDDRDTTHFFENESNGFMMATSVGGSITGEGADILISDDLIDVNDAFSRASRDSTRFWYDNTFYNRLNNAKEGCRINVNQRLHEQDISALIKDKFAKLDGWESLVIPTVKTERQIQTSLNWIDPRKVGEYMHPERFGFNEAQVHMTNTYKWSSQYQQSPVPIGGGIIKKEWIRYYDELPPELDQIIISADLTFKGNKDSDYVCFQCWGRKGVFKYLIDIVRGQWSYAKAKEQFLTFCEKHPMAGKKYIEDKANGSALISDFQKVVPGLEEWPVKNSGISKNIDKVQRVHLISDEYESGLVLIPSKISLALDYVDEITSFTENGSTTGNDDMVDTSTTALIELKTKKRSRFAAH